MSIDGLLHSIGTQGVQFAYLPDVIAFDGVTPESQDFWSEQRIIIASSEYPNHDLLGSEVLCRFVFEQTSGVTIDTNGIVVTADDDSGLVTQIECPLEKHIESDSAVRVSLSFNRVEFYEAQFTIELTEDVRVFPTVE